MQHDQRVCAPTEGRMQAVPRSSSDPSPQAKVRRHVSPTTFLLHHAVCGEGL